jgi:YVTN family beta-propeller protein
VLIVDTAKKAAVGVIDGVGWFPRGIAVRPDGKKLYTANGPSDDVSIIDVASKKVEATVAVPGGPYSLVLIP